MAARWLENLNHVSQISLAVVAIFGYFYTVRPIYQKERLAEQVAEYEGVINKQKPQIAEMQLHLADLQREREQLAKDLLQQRAEASQERQRLTQDAARQRADVERQRNRFAEEVKNAERQLAAVQEEKAKIERQTQFMVYRYRLPDGTPAVTPEQVKTAQRAELERSYLSSLDTACGFGLSFFNDGPFAQFASDPDSSSSTFPFTERELDLWKQYGATYPHKRAIDCIEKVSTDYKQRYAATPFLDDVSRLQKEAIEYADRISGATPWKPPVQPADVIKELAAKRSAIDAERTEALKKVEDEYGNWQSIILPDRREIYRNNYVVSRQNAEMKAGTDRVSLNYHVSEEAKSLRKAIQDEVKRLIISRDKPVK